MEKIKCSISRKTIVLRKDPTSENEEIYVCPNTSCGDYNRCMYGDRNPYEKGRLLNPL